MSEFLVFLQVGLSKIPVARISAELSYRDEVERFRYKDLCPVAHPDTHSGILDGESKHKTTTRILNHNMVHAPAQLLHILNYDR